MNCGRFPNRHFPCGGDAGDRNRTDLTAPFTSLNRDIDAVLAVEGQARQSGPMSVSAPEAPSIIDKHAARAIDDVDESPWGEVERGLRHHGQPNRNSWRCWHLGGDRRGWAAVWSVPQASVFIVPPPGVYRWLQVVLERRLGHERYVGNAWNVGSRLGGNRR